ncbi:16S rRNA (cytosine(967)-C(5))-methyltransferase RsmB [Calditrichota bacterium]
MKDIIPTPRRRLVRKKTATTTQPIVGFKKPRNKPTKTSLPPRDVAVKFYAAWLKNPQRVEPLLEDFHVRNIWSGKDRALFNDLAYGLIRQHGRLSWLLSRFSKQKPPTNRFALAAASIGLYHLQFHDRVPDHAAVDSAVNLTKRYASHELSAWCNAVLHAAINLRDKQGDLNPRFQETIPRLATHYSHPEWLVERWSRSKPVNQLEQLLTWNNRRPDVVIRINSQRTSSTEALEYFKLRGYDAMASKMDANFIHLPRLGDPGKIGLISEGKAVVQDPAQGLAARLLDPKPGEDILDLCAAPGGKALHMADLCPQCNIIATDRSADRLKPVGYSARLLGNSNVQIVDYQSVLGSSKKYDAILIDAPCSGTGVLARRVDLRWRLDSADIPRMASIQMQLLRYASDRLKKGGRIVYSTCTLEPEENEMLISEFLTKNSQFSLVEIPEALSSYKHEELEMLRVEGLEFSSDGAFAVCLKLS